MEQPNITEAHAYQLFLPDEVLNPRQIEERFVEAGWSGFSHNAVRKIVNDAHTKLAEYFQQASGNPSSKEQSEQAFLSEINDALREVVNSYRGTPYFHRVSHAMGMASGLIAAGYTEGDGPCLVGGDREGVKRAIRSLHFKSFWIEGGQCPYCDKNAPHKGVRPYFVLLFSHWCVPNKKFTNKISINLRKSSREEDWIYSALSWDPVMLEGFSPLSDRFDEV